MTSCGWQKKQKGELYNKQLIAEMNLNKWCENEEAIQQK